jgi:hypothetical protein
MGAELLLFQRVAVRDPRLALRAVRAGVVQGAGVRPPQSAMTIMAAVLADELVSQLGGFACFDCTSEEHAETLAAYAYALTQVGAANAAHACEAAAELVRKGQDTDELLAPLEFEFMS